MKYKNTYVIEKVFEELRAAEIKHPSWPDNLFEAVTIITEEVGELAQACLDDKYKEKCPEKIIEEAAQVAAMGIRFLLNYLERK
jgi:NTP pyrophosphatase (non-canonical NTP hydrolase)